MQPCHTGLFKLLRSPSLGHAACRYESPTLNVEWNPFRLHSDMKQMIIDFCSVRSTVHHCLVHDTAG